MADSLVRGDERRCPRCSVIKARADFRHGWCKVCNYEYSRQWAKDNPERVAERSKKYHQEHREKHLKQMAQWHLDNREKHLKQMRDYRTKGNVKNKKEQP